MILSATPEGAVRLVEGRAARAPPRRGRLVGRRGAGGRGRGGSGRRRGGRPGGGAGHARRAGPARGGPVAQIVPRHRRRAAAEVPETDAALIWPARLAWVDPETLTSLIEAHGMFPSAVLRPSYEGEVGWPALLPLEHLAALRALGVEQMPDELLADLAAAGVSLQAIELGDPGVTLRCLGAARRPAALCRAASSHRRPRARVGQPGSGGARRRPARGTGPRALSPSGRGRLAALDHNSGASPASKRMKASSSRTATPSASAFASLEPAFSPATR